MHIRDHHTFIMELSGHWISWVSYTRFGHYVTSLWLLVSNLLYTLLRVFTPLLRVFQLFTLCLLSSPFPVNFHNLSSYFCLFLALIPRLLQLVIIFFSVELTLLLLLRPYQYIPCAFIIFSVSSLLVFHLLRNSLIHWVLVFPPIFFGYWILFVIFVWNILSLSSFFPIKHVDFVAKVATGLIVLYIFSFWYFY